MEQKPWKSWALWLAIVALIVFLVKEFTGLDISDSADGFLNVLLPVLVMLGIVNNPTNKTGIGSIKANPAAARPPTKTTAKK